MIVEMSDGDNGEKGIEKLGYDVGFCETFLLEEMDSYLQDINDRLTVSRMVSDAVIKGMVTAIEQDSDEKISVKDAELVSLYEKLHCSEKPLPELRIQFGDVDPEFKWNSIEQYLKKVKIKLDETFARPGVLCANTTLPVNRSETYVKDVLVAPLENVILNVRKEIDSVSKSIYDELHHDRESIDKISKYVIKNFRNKRENEIFFMNQFDELSSLRNELQQVYRSLFSQEMGQISLHSPLGSIRELNLTIVEDNFDQTAWRNRQLSGRYLSEDPIAFKKCENKVSEEYETLKHFSKDELLLYFKDKISKMKRDHESSIHNITEKYFELKREFLRVKDDNSPIVKYKELEALKRKFADAIGKLANIIVAKDKLCTSYSYDVFWDEEFELDFRDSNIKKLVKDKVHGLLFQDPTIEDEANTEDFNFQNAVYQEIGSIILREVLQDTSDRINNLFISFNKENEMRMHLQAALFEKESALQLKDHEIHRIRKIIGPLSKMMNEEEMPLEHPELVCQELSKLRARVRQLETLNIFSFYEQEEMRNHLQAVLSENEEPLQLHDEDIHIPREEHMPFSMKDKVKIPSLIKQKEELECNGLYDCFEALISKTERKFPWKVDANIQSLNNIVTFFARLQERDETSLEMINPETVKRQLELVFEELVWLRDRVSHLEILNIKFCQENENKRQLEGFLLDSENQLKVEMEENSNARNAIMSLIKVMEDKEDISLENPGLFAINIERLRDWMLEVKTINQTYAIKYKNENETRKYLEEILSQREESLRLEMDENNQFRKRIVTLSTLVEENEKILLKADLISQEFDRFREEMFQLDILNIIKFHEAAALRTFFEVALIEAEKMLQSEIDEKTHLKRQISQLEMLCFMSLMKFNEEKRLRNHLQAMLSGKEKSLETKLKEGIVLEERISSLNALVEEKERILSEKHVELTKQKENLERLWDQISDLEILYVTSDIKYKMELASTTNLETLLPEKEKSIEMEKDEKISLASLHLTNQKDNFQMEILNVTKSHEDEEFKSHLEDMILEMEKSLKSENEEQNQLRKMISSLRMLVGDEESISNRRLSTSIPQDNKIECVFQELDKLRDEMLQLKTLSIIKFYENEEVATNLEASLLENEMALQSQVQENHQLREKILSLSTLVKEYEKNLSISNCTVVHQEEQLKLFSEKLENSKNKVFQLETLNSHREMEIDLINGKLQEALDENSLHKEERRKIAENYMMRLKEFSEEKTKLLACIQEKENIISSAFSTEEKQKEKQIESITRLRHEVFKYMEDIECKTSENMENNISRLVALNHQFEFLWNKAIFLKKIGMFYKQKFEKICSDLQKAENEVDLLGDEVDDLLNLIGKIYQRLDHYSPILKHYPGIMEILELIRRGAD